MSTVKLVEEGTRDPRVRAVFEDIKATKQIKRVPNIWRALATHPEHLELCWTVLEQTACSCLIFSERSCNLAGGQAAQFLSEFLPRTESPVVCSCRAGSSSTTVTA